MLPPPTNHQIITAVETKVSWLLSIIPKLILVPRAPQLFNCRDVVKRRLWGRECSKLTYSWNGLSLFRIRTDCNLCIHLCCKGLTYPHKKIPAKGGLQNNYFVSRGIYLIRIWYFDTTNLPENLFPPISLFSVNTWPQVHDPSVEFESGIYSQAKYK